MTTTVSRDVLFAQALADVVALRTAPAEPAACCAGDRRGYQRHLRRGEDACASSKAAHNAYMRSYLPGWRRARKLKGTHL